MKICIIDDNEDMTKLLSKYFSVKDHQCIVSNDGQNALAIFLNQKFDVVLLDIAMPGFSGIDVIDKLASSGKINDHKIVLFTASSPPPEEIDKMLKKGVHSCLKKPMDPDDLLHYLENLM
jgi:CheY-like chemotaxis protein